MPSLYELAQERSLHPLTRCESILKFAKELEGSAAALNSAGYYDLFRTVRQNFGEVAMRAPHFTEDFDIFLERIHLHDDLNYAAVVMIMESQFDYFTVP